MNEPTLLECPNGWYAPVDDGDLGMRLWRRCTIQGCLNFVCLGASDDYCYPHTIKNLLEQVILVFNHTNDNCRVYPQLFGHMDGKNLNVMSVAEMEDALMWLVDREINIVGPEWMKSALDICERMKLPDE